MDQPKLERLLRLMKLLTANTTYNVDQLAERLQMSRRTIYRYIDTFREAGFVIKKAGDCIRLDKESPHFRDISQLVHFTEEEAVILKNAIENIDDTNLLKQNLKRKLYSVYDNKTLADTVVRGKNAPNIRTLIEAIEQERQAILHSYQSPHGGEVRDRRWSPSPSRPTTCRCGATILKKPHEQTLQNLAHRLCGAYRRGLGTRGGAPRRVHRRLPHARWRTPPRAAGAGNCWPTTCYARSIRWPNVTSGRWGGEDGCSTPRSPGLPAWDASPSGCWTTSASSTPPS